ncbi:MAG TPA: cytochrome c oxidase subunit II [Stellaceae bacterium]|nr:cytochrome c oxidase subunit II [Stellaceae bacterium]
MTRLPADGITDFARRAARALLGLPALLLGALPAWAETAHDWQLGLQPAATPVRDRIDSLNNELIVIITVITLFVMALLGYVMIRYSAKRNPAPSRTTHNTLLELVWTLVPVLVLVIIAVPSFKLLYFMADTPRAQMTVKVTGHQWYWSYDYPDQGDFSFDSNILSDAQDKQAGNPRLLGTDNVMVVPVGQVVRVLINSTDVIHSWFVPSAGVQEYAMPGRTNEAWFKFERPGVYYGQCNQICGINHPFMPIEIHAVSADDFTKWAADAKKKFSSNDDGALKFAADASR